MRQEIASMTHTVREPWLSLGILAHLALLALMWPAGLTAAQVEEKGPLAFHRPTAARFAFGGVLGTRIQANLDQWLLTAPAANPGLLDMFRVRDRQPRPELVPWAGEFVGKYLLSAVQAQRMVRSDALDKTVREVVDQLIASQADDGYLGPFTKSERLLANWDLWGHDHIMLALMMYAQDADYAPAMQACTRAADLICKTYLDGSRRVFDAGSHEMNMAVIQAMGQLYRITGNERYLQMMRHIEKDWERAGDYLRTGLAGVPFYRTPRPRWESLLDLQGLIELYRITGEGSYKQAFTSHWTSIARFDRHNSGSFSTGEGAIGNPYAPGAIETCCTIAWVALTNDYLQLTGASIAADELEWSTYNAVLGSQHPSGRWWTYNTPMDGARLACAHTIVFQARAGTPELNCCSVNGPRGLGMLSEWAVHIDADGPVVNHYGPCTISFQLADKTSVTLTQKTDYPASGAIRLQIDVREPTQFDLRLRIPAWSRHTEVSVKGRTIQDVKPGTYLSLPRLWHRGDTVDLLFDMRPRYWVGACEQAGRASLHRGPLLLAFDPHYNSFDANELPTIDLRDVAMTPVTLAADGPPGFPPMVLFDLKAPDGHTIRLCDFATAGAYGNEYRSWLPAANGDASNPWLIHAPTYPTPETFSTDPDGVFVASPLDGSGEPTRGKLQTARNVAPAADRHGRGGGAVAFNGKDSRLQYEITGFPPDYTVCAWVYVNASSAKTYQQVFSAWSGDSSDPLRISIMGDKLCARVEAGQTYSTAGVPISTGRWLHVAAVRSGDRLDLYVDGTLRDSTSVPVATCPTTIRNFALGANPNYDGDEYLDGRIDDFTFHARALSAAEVRRTYENGE
jgi:DUF1680 family protein